jgi:sec-independent protein translocase protein TatA
MGLGGISLWQLLIILLIVVMIFGTKKLSSIGGDLGGAVKGFRKAMSDADKEDDDPQRLDKPDAEFSEVSGEKAEQNTKS